MTAFLQALLALLLQSTGLLLLGLSGLGLTRRQGPTVQTLLGRATLSGAALLVLLTPLSGHVQAVWRIAPPRVSASPVPHEPNPQQVVPLAQLHPTPKREGEELVPSQHSAVDTSKVGTKSTSHLESATGTKDVPGTVGAASSAPTMTILENPHPSFRKDPVTEGRGSKEVGLYVLVSCALLLRLAICQRHLTRLRRTARPIASGPAVDLLAALTPTSPQLLTHPTVHSPFLAGLRRPAIFLPSVYETEFSRDALRAILAHELAHLTRRDNLWTLAARLLTAILWCQPLLWLLCRRLEQISEDACDEAVLAQNCPPRAYADCLLSLATRPPLGHHQRTLAAGVAPIRSSLGRRVQRILCKGTRPMPPVTTRLRLTIAALALAAALGGACLVSSAPAQMLAPTQTTAPEPFVPTAQELRHEAERKQDLQNLKEIGLAITQYTQDNDERFPDAAHWMDQITPYLEGYPALFDPFQPGKKRYGYAFNRNCSRKSISAFNAPSETVVVFDSTKGTRDASDTGQSLRVNPPSSSRINVIGSSYGFADGHAKWFRPEVHPSFALDGGVIAGSEPPANPSIVGTWLCSHDDGTGNVLIFSPNGIVEGVGPWPGSSTAAGHSYGPNSRVGHAYGRYTTAGPNLVYTLTRVWVEGEKPWTTDPEKHRDIYSISGGTLILRWRNYKSISRRVPAYTQAMLGLKSNPGDVPIASSALSMRQATLRQITAQLKNVSEKKPIVAIEDPALDRAQFLAGLTPVQGPGVVVTLRDSKQTLPKILPAGVAPPNLIHDADIGQVLDELRAAGAEAISVNNQRMVATSAVCSAGPTIYINNTPQAPPYAIKAIGDPKTLARALSMPGGMASQLGAYDKAMFTFQKASALTLPAYTGGNEPRYAKPVSPEDPIQEKRDFLRKTQAQARQHSPTRGEQVIVTLNSNGVYFLDGVTVVENQIEPLLAARCRKNPNIEAVIKCSRNQPHSRVEKLLDLAKQAGIHFVAITVSSASSGQDDARSLLRVQRAQTAARIAKLDTENASLNVRLQAIRKEVFQKIKYITPPNPPVAMASGEVGLHAKLHGRIEAQRHTEIKSIQEKIQFMNDVSSYTQRWVALYNELGDGEKDILNQASRDRALRSQLQAQIAVLDARILQQNHGALNH